MAETSDPSSQGSQGSGDTGTGGGDAHWSATLPGEMHDVPFIKESKDLESFARSAVEARNLIGKSVQLPGEDATPEQLKEFGDKVGKVPGMMHLPEGVDAVKHVAMQHGLPETPDGYEHEIAEGLTEKEFNPELITEFNKLAHGLSFTPEQYAGMRKFEEARLIAQKQQDAADVATAQAMLQKEYGLNVDNAVGRAFQLLQNEQLGGGNQLASAIERDGLKNNPHLVHFLAQVSKHLGEDMVAGGGSGSSVETQSDRVKAHQAKVVEAANAQSAGDYAAAERLGKEAAKLAKAAFGG